MDNPFIIMSAPNGARRQKSDHPRIPITPDEMAICARQIRDEGASILHLHVRDDDDRHSLDVDRYRESTIAIKTAVGNDLIIQATTEAVGMYDKYQQMDMVRALKPEATSLALRELCPDEKDLPDFANFMNWIKRERIFAQIILYNSEDFLRFEDYIKRGVFHDDQTFALFVFGSYQGPSPQVTKSTETLKKRSLTAQFPWAVCGFADNERDCVSHAAHNGGHIRVGFENNIWDDDRGLLENNAEMVKFAARTARDASRQIASTADVRNKFNLRD